MKDCYWCKEAGLNRSEIQKPDDMTGATDIDGNWICDDCRDAAESEGLIDIKRDCGADGAAH